MKRTIIIFGNNISMDSNQQFPIAVSENTTAGISNQIIIFVLLALLILSFLGINLLTMFSHNYAQIRQ